MKLIIFLTLSFLVFLSSNVFAKDDERFCKLTEVKEGRCEKGDLLYVPSHIWAMKLCDFEKKVVTFSRGKDLNGIAVCHYYGYERKIRQ
ncbi:hypothetical protein [Vreelandella salicampi]|uniref:DUF1496 domain-containing protein n=1 Tax=Vreelandella salicampi TaxID=1449798 RepID=A0A7Z0RWD2_9GAMM|nr:hypothetical protein [Halomonas salicampi]NYS62529.1 hypothetical protein [Halomonas salicampi]